GGPRHEVVSPPGREGDRRGPGGHGLGDDRRAAGGDRGPVAAVRARGAVAPGSRPGGRGDRRARGSGEKRGLRAMNLSVIEPATEIPLASIPRADEDAARTAVARAKAAYPAWRAVPPADRARLLYRLADALEAELEELAVLEARNAGKPI